MEVMEHRNSGSAIDAATIPALHPVAGSGGRHYRMGE